MLCRAGCILILVLLFTGCASTKKREPVDRRFVFERDTFAFANELLWEYAFDEETGERTTVPREPRPEFHHYCFPMLRAARQFYDFAEFHPAVEPDPRTNILADIDAVMDRAPRSDPAAREKVQINGYTGLRELSREYEAELKERIGGKWQSWFQRGNWRMVFPFSRGGQLTTAQNLVRLIENGQAPVVHLTRFPSLTINHAMIVFAFEELDAEILFRAYDPNTPHEPLTMTFRWEERTFDLPPTPYWRGGRVDVYEVFKNWGY
jgi:hypothetical protein